VLDITLLRLRRNTFTCVTTYGKWRSVTLKWLAIENCRQPLAFRLHTPWTEVVPQRREWPQSPFIHLLIYLFTTLSTVYTTYLKLWPCLDVQPGLGPMSLDNDGIVSSVSVVHVSYGKSVAASGHADVVLGSVLKIEPIFEPLGPGVWLRNLALERRRLAETRHPYVGQRTSELHRFHWIT